MLGRSALALAMVVVCGCSAQTKEAVGETSSRETVASTQKTAICWDDYNCFAPFATTQCFEDGSCLYTERAPAEYKGAIAHKPKGGAWQIDRPSNCDRYCAYLMASSPDNVSRWDLGGHFDVGDACNIAITFCFDGSDAEPDKK